MRQVVSSVVGVVRYTGVLAVWSGLLLVRPRLALELLHERRADSPLPRFGLRLA